MISTATQATFDPNLSRYMREVRKTPMLSLEEEQRLARAWRDHEHAESMDRLVTSHLGLVVKIAVGYRAYGLPIAELISEGNLGMVQAVRRFEPDRGFRLSTYARWWIRAAIQDHIMRSWSLVKVGTTAAQKKLFFNLRRVKGQMRAVQDGDLEPQQVTTIARILGVPEHEVIGMNRRLAARDHSLNAPVGPDSEDQTQDWLVDDAPTQVEMFAERQERTSRKAMLTIALTQLKPRERHILVERRLRDDPVTLEQLSDHHRISRERVRQIEMRALQKLQRAANAHCNGNRPADIRAEAA
jgi:RNA polymerase sigma-32 factor